MKLPESIATVRCAGSSSSSRADSTLASIVSRWRCPSVATSFHRPSRSIRSRIASVRYPATVPPTSVGEQRRAVTPTSRTDAEVGSGDARPARLDRRRSGRPSCASPTSVPCRVVHMLSAQPQETSRSAPAISSAANGEAKPPEIPSEYGSPRNRPFATADVASSAPHAAADTSDVGFRVPGAAAGDEHRPLAPAEGGRRGGSRSASAGAAGTAGAHRVVSGRRRRDLVALDVEADVEHDGAPFADRGGARAAARPRTRCRPSGPARSPHPRP